MNRLIVGLVSLVVISALAFSVQTVLSQHTEPKEEPTETKVTWLDDCSTKCENGKCNTIIGKTEWADEGDGCKNIREIDDLSKTGKFKVVIESDEVHGVEVVKYNYSCITVRPYSIDDSKFEFGNNIPFKIGNEEPINIRTPNKETPISEITICPEMTALINYSFGEHSTSIVLQDANTQNLDDTELNAAYPDVPQGSSITNEIVDSSVASSDKWAVYNFNLTNFTNAVPPGSNIDEAQLYLYNGYDGIDSGESFYIQAHRYLSSWSEEGLTWNNKGSEGTDWTTDYESRMLAIPGITNQWINWTVTDFVATAYSANAENISILLKPILVSGSPAASDDLNTYSKEWGSTMPYLNITYSEAAGDTCDTCTIDCTENCAVDSALDCSGNTLTFTGSGTISLSAEITNFDEAVIRGGCNIICTGGTCLI